MGKGFKIGFKIGSLYGTLSAILLVLLNLHYVEKIITLLSIVIYFYFGFGIGLGILGILIGILLRILNLHFESWDKKKIYWLILFGGACILFYSALQYRLDLVEYQYSLVPLSIKTIRIFIYIQVIIGILALTASLIESRNESDETKPLLRWVQKSTYRLLPFLLLLVTAILVDSGKGHKVVAAKPVVKQETKVESPVKLVPAAMKKIVKSPKPLVSVDSTKTGPVIFIGWDGADWAVAQPLLDQGKLPNLKKLIENGASGKIKTFRPTLSPAIWTSIATGKKPLKTGIIHFLRLGDSAFFDESLGAVPMNRTVTGVEYFVLAPMNAFLRIAEYGLWNIMINDRTNREVKAVWNIAGDSGKKVGVVNMMITTPVEKINGYMVSDYLQLRMKGSTSVTYPPTLYGEIKPFEITDNQVTPAMVDDLFPQKGMAEKLSHEERPPNAIFWDVLKQAYSEDQSTQKYSQYIYNTYHPDLMVVYFHAPDTICHHFWKFLQPDKFWGVSEGDKKRFGDLINRYYEDTDKLLAPWVAELDKGATVIISSDHGFEPISASVEKMHFLTHTFISGDHRHMPPGMIVMAGPQIRKNIKIPMMNVLDITPTLLWFLDIPVAEDMDGTIPVDAVTKEFAVSHQPKVVKSYESAEGNAQSSEGGVLSEQYRERLRSLGYIQ